MRIAFALAGGFLLLGLMAQLCLGSVNYSPVFIVNALMSPDPDSYDHYVVQTQRLPRAAIASYIGALMAMGGAVVQSLSRNPIASPQILGINAGAALFVVLIAVFLKTPDAQPHNLLGPAALLGGVFGFAACLMVARLAAVSGDPRGLGLILSGAVVSMLLSGVANAVLLSDPHLRSEFLGWLAGNINHVYAPRFYQFWWIGAVSALLLFVLARPLTLISLGRDTAAATGVAVLPVTLLGLGAVILGTSSAVAICGPVGFVGLVVPHMVRPFTGNTLTRLLPVCALAGAGLCLWADVMARKAFQPFVLHTGVVMDLLGGLVFVWIVRRHYFQPRQARGAVQ